jgi:hypothetical protein
MNQHQIKILKSWCTLDEDFLLKEYGIIGMTQTRIMIREGLNFE